MNLTTFEVIAQLDFSGESDTGRSFDGRRAYHLRHAASGHEAYACGMSWKDAARLVGGAYWQEWQPVGYAKWGEVIGNHPHHERGGCVPLYLIPK